MSSLRRVALLALALMAFAVNAAPALAVETHLDTGIAFGPNGTGAGSNFNEIGGVAADPANGNVYVYDSGESKLYKFDAAGNPADFSSLGANVIEGTGGLGYQGANQVAVAPPGSPGGTAGDIYVANLFEILIFAPDGEKLGQLIPGEITCGVAVSPSGHVFAEVYPETIKEYVPAGNPVSSADETGSAETGLGEICNLAADGLGNIYAANPQGESVPVFKLEGLQDKSPEALESELEPRGRTLAIDPATDDVYVSRGSSVAQYDSSGAPPINAFETGLPAESLGIAVNGQSGDVYVGKGRFEGRVHVFGPLVTAAGVSAEDASAITPLKATLNGVVNPDGVAVSDCRFEYGETTEYGKTAPCEGAIPTDSEDHPVSASLDELSVDTTYHFRLLATNANATNKSQDHTFTTAKAAFTGTANPVSGAKATLNGVVFPEGEALSDCRFEYGTDTSYGNTTPCQGAVPADEGEHAVTAALTHLVPNGTQYHFRLVIERPSGTVEGADASFKTKDTVITGAASAIAPPSARIEGTLNPEGTPYTECKFEYGPAAPAYGSTVPCAESPAAIGTGASPVSVHADLSGLAFEATYHYRLVAANADAAVNGEDRSFNTPGVPLIEDQRANGVTDTEARLVARINPKSLATTFHLEYGTSAAYGQSTAEAEVGEDETGHTLSTPLAGLAPDTVYHWRAVASNSHGTTAGIDRTFTTPPTFSAETDCPNQAFRGGLSGNLPDCRAYEMVSPAQKAGEVFAPEPLSRLGSTCPKAGCLPGGNETGLMPMQSTIDGEAVVYMGLPFTAGVASGKDEYRARRSASGWATQSLSTPLFQRAEGQGYKVFSADLSRGVVYQGEPPLSPEAPTSEGKSFANLYLLSGDGSLRPLVTEEPAHRVSGRQDVDRFRIAYLAANAGAASAAALSHVIFEANDALTGEVPGIAPEAPTIAANEWNLYEWADGQLRLVNVLPGNTEAAAGAVLGSGQELFTRNDEAPGVDQAISADGQRIFWSTKSNGQVYVRIDGEETRKIEDPGKFLTASPDGSKVLLSDGCLYDLEEEECEDDLSQGEGEKFQGILGGAEDLSRIYFVDTGALTPPGEENANGEHAEAGKLNLYGWDEGATTFIGALSSDDNLILRGLTPDKGAWMPSSSSRTAQVSPDGKYLAFMSVAPLTGYDNNVADRGKCLHHVVPGSSACYEVFEYQADSQSLACASCNPSGESPQGGANLSLIAGAAGSPGFRQPGNLSTEGGGRLFFESQNALSPRDTNGPVQDVYEWEPNGLGGCKRAAGCISLISSGHSANDSMFVDSTPSGNDAFFVTREQLLPRDRDDLLDLYDARVGGGISESTAPPCLGEACKGRGTSAPEQQSAGSLTFSGPGNEKAKKHKKHKKKRRKHAHKHKSQKRSAKHNKGGRK